MPTVREGWLFLKNKKVWLELTQDGLYYYEVCVQTERVCVCVHVRARPPSHVLLRATEAR